ncbi:hypothetical protein BPOR_0076g00100 [Botrytis porri]|uniref:Uncharacterized protein n=1 Tax=Botrytis porri TaxID=87229 RepID=A0A4Z1L0C3_9HELO|nr:hypothetical protein BPOR_0076g00100 [Botrytis porri]
MLTGVDVMVSLANSRFQIRSILKDRSPDKHRTVTKNFIQESRTPFNILRFPLLVINRVLLLEICETPESSSVDKFSDLKSALRKEEIHKMSNTSNQIYSSSEMEN